MPQLFFGKVFSNEEQFGFYYPINKYYQDELQNGGDLVWNSGYYGGVSAALDQFVSSYFPLKAILFSALPLYSAHHWMIAIGVFAGLTTMYLFGRSQGWPRGAALLSSLAYGTGTTLGWLQIGTTAAYSFITLPGLALALSQIARRKMPFWYFLLGALSLSMGLVAGFIQIVFYAATLGFLYALFLDWSAWGSERGIKRFRVTLWFLGMATMSGLISLPQVLPSASYINLTIRTADYAIQNAYSPSPAELIAFFFPEFVRIPFIGGGSAGFYVGALSLVFAAVGIFLYRSKEAVFWLVSYLVVLAFAFHLPIFSWINEHVPPFSRMGGNFRWMVIGAFPLAYLVGHGYSRFMSQIADISYGERRRILIALGTISVVFILGLFLVVFGIAYLREHAWVMERVIEWRFSGREMSLPLEHYQRAFMQAIDEIASLVSLENPWFLLALVFWPLSWFLLFLLFKNRLREKTFNKAVVSFAVLNLLVAFLPQMANTVNRSVYETEPVIAKALKQREADPASYRFIGFLVGDGLYWEAFSKRRHSVEEIAYYHREYAINNTNLFWDVQRMDGMEPYRTLRLNRLLNTVLAADEDLRVFAPGSDIKSEGLNKLENNHAMRRASFDEKRSDFLSRLPLVSMMNVKYLYSPYELQHNDLRQIYVPTIEEVAVQPKLYENKKVLPRIYFAGGVQFEKGDEIDALLEVAKVPDFSKMTVIECQECTGVDAAGSGKAAVRHYENGNVLLDVETEAGGWLIFSENFLPGWHASIDGAETAIYPANYIFQAVYVPEGTHEIRFEFRDRVGDHLARLLKQMVQ